MKSDAEKLKEAAQSAPTRFIRLAAAYYLREAGVEPTDEHIKEVMLALQQMRTDPEAVLEELTIDGEYPEKLKQILDTVDDD